MASRLGHLSEVRVLVAILAAAFNLRIGIVAVGPLIEDIRADTAMSSALAGALTMIPFVCMGIFAFLGPPLVQRIGTVRVVILSLGLITIGSLGRGASAEAWLILMTTVPIGLGIALIGVTLPVVVKDRFPTRAGAVTGAYVATLSVGIALVGFGLVPLAEGVGGWRPAFLIAATPSLVAICLWLGMEERMVLPRRAPAAGELPARIGSEAMLRLRRALPSRTGLLLGLAFGLQSTCFAGMVSWAPAVYEEAGWSQATAALSTSSIGVGTIVSALIFPPLTDGRDRRPWIAAIGLMMGLGVVGVGLATTSAAWLWLAMFGLGTGAVFPLMLALPLDLNRDPIEVGDLAAWMLGLGFLISASAPVLIGALRDASGGFELPMSLLGSLGLTGGLLALLLPKPLPTRGRRP
jgi:MFS transporter, CP family, cyanate transporter